MREKSFYVNRGSFFVCTCTLKFILVLLSLKSNLYYMKKRILLWYIPIMGIPLIFRDIDKCFNKCKPCINQCYISGCNIWWVNTLLIRMVMRCFLVMFSLYNPEKNYTKVVNKILDSYPEHIKLFKFNWILKSDSTRYDIINNLAKVIDNEGVFIVIELDSLHPSLWTTRGVSTAINNWLIKHLS